MRNLFQADHSQASIDDLAEEVGHFIEYWGFKRVHGKIWLHLFLSARPLDAQDLMDLLGISKGLVSISVKTLLNHEVILEAGKSKKGTQLYIANPNVTEVILGVLRQRERRMLGRIETVYNLAKRNSQDLSEHRIQVLGDMIRMAKVTLDSLLSLHQIDPDFLSKFRNIPTERSK